MVVAEPREPAVAVQRRHRLDARQRLSIDGRHATTHDAADRAAGLSSNRRPDGPMLPMERRAWTDEPGSDGGVDVRPFFYGSKAQLLRLSCVDAPGW